MTTSRYGDGLSAVGKRYYDPEDRRQRRLGQAQAATGIAGAGATGAGAFGIARDTKKVRERARQPSGSAKTNADLLVEANKDRVKMNRKPLKMTNPGPAMSSEDVKGMLSVKRKNAALLGGGLLGIGAATQITRNANSNRGRGWN